MLGYTITHNEEKYKYTIMSIYESFKRIDFYSFKERNVALFAKNKSADVGIWQPKGTKQN